MPRRKDPRIPDAVLDQLLAGADPKTVFDPNGLLDNLKSPGGTRSQRRDGPSCVHQIQMSLFLPFSV
jgi:putative transposase